MKRSNVNVCDQLENNDGNEYSCVLSVRTDSLLQPSKLTRNNYSVFNYNSGIQY